MNPRTLHTQLRVGQVARLKKAHPCGSRDWEVLRLGTEVKLRCTGCGHLVSLPRSKLATALREILPAPGGLDREEAGDGRSRR
jgi:hypothetical protein